MPSTITLYRWRIFASRSDRSATAAGSYREAREVRANAGGWIARCDEIADDGHCTGARADDVRRRLQRHASYCHEWNALRVGTGGGEANAFETETLVARVLGIRAEYGPN